MFVNHCLRLTERRARRQVFRGHKREAASLSWHPIHETLFSSGGSDGSLMFWNVGSVTLARAPSGGGQVTGATGPALIIASNHLLVVLSNKREIVWYCVR